VHGRQLIDVVNNRELVTASSTTKVSTAVRLMKQGHATAILVCKKGRLVGIFTEHDALLRVLAEQRDPRATPLADVMTCNPQTIGPDCQLGHALHLMYEGGIRNLPVVRNGRPIGILSARDALGPELNSFVDELEQREHLSEILG
jgi:CBS domain-containing protein